MLGNEFYEAKASITEKELAWHYTTRWKAN